MNHLPVSAYTNQIEDFRFDPVQKRFIYLGSGMPWVAAAINAVVAPVEHEGRLWKPTDYLRMKALAK